MANIKNYIETIVRLKTSGAQKSSDQLFKKIKKDSKSTEKNLKGVDKGMKSVGNSAVVAGAKTKKGFGGLGKMFAGMKGAILSAVPALNSFKMALVSTGVGAIVVALGAFVGVMFKAAKTGAAFGKSLSTLKGISGATKDELKVLSTQAKDLGATTAFTASQVLELQTELAKLGFTADQIGDATPSILDLAASLDVGLGEAAEFAGSVVRAFGLETSETQRVVDIMASSAVNSAQNFDSLRESFKLAAPAASALNVSVEDTATYLGALANSGLKGSIAGTGLAKTFIMLHKEGLTLEEGLDKVTNSADPLGTAIDLVGVIAGKTLLTLAKSGDSIAYLEAKMKETEGTAAALAKIKLDNLSGDVTKLGSAWEGFLLGIEDGTGLMVTMARGVVQATTAFLGLFSSTKKVSESMDENRISLYKQEAQIKALDKVIADSTSTSDELVVAQGDRKAIIDDLIEQNPDLLAGLDAEKATTEDLVKAIDSVNESMSKKIVIQKQQEAIDEQAEETSDALVDFMNAESDALERTAKLRKDLADAGIEITATDPAGVIAEATKAIEAQGKAEAQTGEKQKTTTRERQVYYKVIQGLTGALEDSQDAEADYNEQLAIGNGLIEDRIKTEERLGLVETESQKAAREAREAKEKAEEEAAEKEKQRLQKLEEDRIAREEKAAKDLAKKIKKDGKDAIKLAATLLKEEEDLEAKTKEQKLELEKQRRIKSVEALLIDDAAKKALLSQINDQYDREEDLLAQKRKEEFQKFSDAQDELTKVEKLEKQREAKILELETLVATETEKRELLKQINDQYDAKILEEKMVKAMAEAEIQLEIDAAKLEAKREAGTLELEEELAFLEKRRQQELMNTELTAKEIESINARYNSNAQKIQKTADDATKASRDKSLNDAMDGAAAAFGIAQEVAVAKMIIAAPEAIAGSFKEAAKSYAPPVSLAMGALGAAGTIAPIIKGLADIKKTRFSGSKKGPPSGTISGAGGGGGVAGAMTPTALNDIASNNAARLGMDTDMTNGAAGAASNNILGGQSANVTFSEGSYKDFRRQVSFKEDKTSL
jgi:hypothetical protein